MGEEFECMNYSQHNIWKCVIKAAMNRNIKLSRPFLLRDVLHDHHDNHLLLDVLLAVSRKSQEKCAKKRRKKLGVAVVLLANVFFWGVGNVRIWGVVNVRLANNLTLFKSLFRVFN